MGKTTEAPLQEPPVRLEMRIEKKVPLFSEQKAFVFPMKENVFHISSGDRDEYDVGIL